MNNNQLYTFSQPKSFNFFLTHINKVFYIVILAAIVVTYQDLKGNFLENIIVLVIILISILMLCEKFLLKVIWRLDIDFNKEIITFYLCKKKTPLYACFNEIEQIKVSGPISFNFKKKKLLYSTKQYMDILPILNKIKKIKWGSLCDSLGPEKSIRDLIDKQNL